MSIMKGISRSLSSIASTKQPRSTPRSERSASGSPAKTSKTTAPTSGPGAGQTTAERLLQQSSPLDSLRKRSPDSEPPSVPRVPSAQNAPWVNQPSDNTVTASPLFLEANVGVTGFSPLLFPVIDRETVLGTGNRANDSTTSPLGHDDPTAEFSTGSPPSPDEALAEEIENDFRESVEASDPTSANVQTEHVVEAVDTLARIEDIEDARVREQLLNDLAPEIADLGVALNALDQDDLDKAISTLTQTTESLGISQHRLLIDPLARGFESEISAKSEQHGDLRDSIFRSIEAGDGALFGTGLADALHSLEVGSGDPEYRSLALERVSAGTARGLRAVNERFDEAYAAKSSLDNDIANFIFEFGDTLNEEELQDGIQAVIDKHRDIIDEFEAASELLGTTFDGVSTQPTGDILHRTDDPQAEIWHASFAVRDNLEAFAESDAGEALFSEAIVANSEGEVNFFTHIGSFATSINSAKGNSDKVANLIFKITAARASSLIEANDLEGAAELFESFKTAAPFIGVSNPDKLDELADLLRNRDQFESAEAFADEFSDKTNEIKGTAGPGGSDSQVARGFKLLGIAVGVASIVDSVRNLDTRDELIPGENYARLATDGSGILGQISDLLPEGKAGKELLEKFGKLAKAGVLFDTIDVIQKFRSGDTAGAGLALSSLVGGILITSSSVGPVGTAVGTVLVIGAVVGEFGLSRYRSGQIEKSAEEDLQTFLEGAGFSPEDAKILRDVNGSQQSVGRIFTQIAELHPGLSARDVLDLFLNIASRTEGPGGLPLADDGLELVVNRQQLIDDIEKLERDEDGNFTADSVQKAIALFDEQLGVSLDPAGYTSESALDALDANFDQLDRNGDGQISKGELEDAVEEYEELQTFIGPLTQAQAEQHQDASELAGIANYVLRREALLDRLDVGGGLDSDNTDRNDRISREDIDAVREQNSALNILYTYRDVFDSARQGDPTKADGQISRGDLEAVRDGDYPQALKDAASFLLENDRFFNLVDRAVTNAESSDAPDPGNTGNGELNFDDLAAAVLGLHVNTA